MSVNKVILIGNVGKDPEIKQIHPDKGGGFMASFSLATSEYWKDKSTGENKEKTEWHRIVVYSQGLAELVKNYVRKGTKLYICGSLQTRKWVERDVEKYTTEVVLTSFNSELKILNKKDPLDYINQEDSPERYYDSPERSNQSDAHIKKFLEETGGYIVEEEQDQFIEDEIPF